MFGTNPEKRNEAKIQVELAIRQICQRFGVDPMSLGCWGLLLTDTPWALGDSATRKTLKSMRASRTKRRAVYNYLLEHEAELFLPLVEAMAAEEGLVLDHWLDQNTNFTLAIKD